MPPFAAKFHPVAAAGPPNNPSVDVPHVDPLPSTIATLVAAAATRFRAQMYVFFAEVPVTILVFAVRFIKATTLGCPKHGSGAAPATWFRLMLEFAAGVTGMALWSDGNTTGIDAAIAF